MDYQRWGQLPRLDVFWELQWKIIKSYGISMAIESYSTSKNLFVNSISMRLKTGFELRQSNTGISSRFKHHGLEATEKANNFPRPPTRTPPTDLRSSSTPATCTTCTMCKSQLIFIAGICLHSLSLSPKIGQQSWRPSTPSSSPMWILWKKFGPRQSTEKWEMSQLITAASMEMRISNCGRAGDVSWIQCNMQSILIWASSGYLYCRRGAAKNINLNETRWWWDRIYCHSQRWLQSRRGLPIERRILSDCDDAVL